MGVFDNAKNVEINGKTVKSIIKKDDDGVIYGEGSSPTPKIQTHMAKGTESWVIENICLFDENNNPIGGKKVRFLTTQSDEIMEETTTGGGAFFLIDYIVWAVFEGDETYEGCRWDRPVGE